jgi:hypothetical protein
VQNKEKFVSSTFIQVLFHIHILPRFLLFFSIVKFSVGAIVDASTH